MKVVPAGSGLVTTREEATRLDGLNTRMMYPSCPVVESSCRRVISSGGGAVGLGVAVRVAVGVAVGGGGMLERYTFARYWLPLRPPST